MMDDFKVIYKVLKYLSDSLGADEFDQNQISADRLRVSEERLEQLMILMQDSGYIRGLVVSRGLSDTHRRAARPMRPEITLDGLEYLAENSMMAKAKNILMGVVDVVK